MDGKSVCIISANCQGAYIKALLNAHADFARDFEVHYFVNYQKQSVPSELLARCDLLIYQPLGANWGDLSNDSLLAAVPEGCRRIAINYLTFPVYWPGFAIDPRNVPTPAYPFGPFPYGDRVVIEALAAGESPARAAERFAGDEYPGSVDPDAVIADYVLSQRQIETRRDQKLLDYIMAHFRSAKLFETYNHPTQPLCVHQVNDLLAMLGYRALEAAEELPLDYLTINQQPLHPGVAQALGLAFEATEETIYRIWGQPMSFGAYAGAYAKWDVEAIGRELDGSTPPPPPPPSGADVMSKHTRAAKPKPLPVALPEGQRQWVFLHIPKTAGTSLNDMFDEALGSNPAPHYNATVLLMKDAERRSRPLIRGHIHYDAIDALRTERLVFTFLRDPVDRTISAFEFMKSHPETWLGKLAQGSLTEFLAHPYVTQSIADLQTRMLGSAMDVRRLYARLVRKDLTQEQYFEEFRKRSLLPPDEASLERASERLLSMLHVGFTETFAEDCETLFAKLSLPCPAARQSNRTPSAYRRRDSYTEAELDLVRSVNRFDAILYARAQALRAQGRI